MTQTSTADSATTKKQYLYAVPLLMLIGIGCAAWLVLEKLSVAYAINYSSACNFGGKFDCSAVQGSDYSTVLGVPVAIWALPTYAVMILLGWLGLRNQPSDGPDAPARAVAATNLLVVLSGLMVLYSVVLAYVQWAVIGAFCVFCLAMYICQLGVFIAAIMATPTSFGDAFKGGLRTALGGDRMLAPVAATFGVILAVSLIWYHSEDQRAWVTTGDQAVADAQTMILDGRYTEAVQLLGELEKRGGEYGAKAQELSKKAIDAQFSADFGAPAAQPSAEIPEPSVAGTSSAPSPAQPEQAAQRPQQAVQQPQPKPDVAAQAGGGDRVPMKDFTLDMVEVGGDRTDEGWTRLSVPILEEDFVYGPADAPITIVEFADFECGYCRMLSQNLKTIREKWKGKVRFVFKYYPMDGACNPRMGGQRMHPDACTAAKASYCAGKQGKFYEAHDKLFAMQKNNQPDKVPGYMEQIGVDMAQWKACMDSSEPGQRITTDIRMAAKAGIIGTPRMFINTRLVSGASTVSIIDYYIKKALEAPAPSMAAAGAQGPKAVAPTADMSPMVQAATTGGKFFIDRFEASIDGEGRAVSLPNVRPAQVSWFEAKQACEKGGKRLCTEEEWISACAGQPAEDDNDNRWFNDDEIEGSRYPYGPFYDAGACHAGGDVLEGETVATGSKHMCRTESGVYDLTGNISEWIENDESRASLVGGSFGSGEGAACNRRGTMFGPGIRNNTTGFRCCADAMVANATKDAGDLQDLPEDLIGQPVPDFTIKTSDGQTIDRSSWKGNVSYITFFASWCGSCKRELPELSKWNTELKDKGFQVVAIGVDRNSKQSEDFAKKYEANYTVALDPDATAMTQFDIAAMPTSFIVDKEGVVRKRIVGFKPEDVPSLRSFIDSLL